jgi:hypothetical protein
VYTVVNSVDDLRPYQRFTDVTVGGTAVSAENYTREEGSLILTLKRSYLDTLADGDYPVRISFTDGYADGLLTILAAEGPTPTPTPTPTVTPTPTPTPTAEPTATPTPTPKPIPKTGDADQPAMWLFLMLIGAAGLIVMTAWKAYRK